MIHHRTGWDMLDRMAPPAPQRFTRDLRLRGIITDTARAHGFRLADMIREDRSRPVSRVRQEAMLVAHLEGFSQGEIGRALHREQSTVRHGITQARRWAQEDTQ